MVRSAGVSLTEPRSLLWTYPVFVPCCTQFRIACAAHSNSRASPSAVHPVRTNSTMCCRYTGAYRRIFVIVTPPDQSLRVPTNPGQLHYPKKHQRFVIRQKPIASTETNTTATAVFSQSTDDIDQELPCVKPRISTNAEKPAIRVNARANELNLLDWS